MAVAVAIEHLSKFFGQTRAVDDVTLTVEPGELFFLLGPSGCGKTTLLRCVAGFCEPDCGSIRFGDRDITRLPPHRRDHRHGLPELCLVAAPECGGERGLRLEMRGLSKGEIVRRTAEALETVHMPEHAQHRPNQLSGGQQQRVALARALVIRPQCLLLDEPLSNLDAKLRTEMRAEIRRICKEAGLTAIYVTHDQKEALSIADRLAVLDGGKLQQGGRPAGGLPQAGHTFCGRLYRRNELHRGDVAEAGKETIVVRTAIGLITSAVGGQIRFDRPARDDLSAARGDPDRRPAGRRERIRRERARHRISRRSRAAPGGHSARRCALEGVRSEPAHLGPRQPHRADERCGSAKRMPSF